MDPPPARHHTVQLGKPSCRRPAQASRGIGGPQGSLLVSTCVARGWVLMSTSQRLHPEQSVEHENARLTQVRGQKNSGATAVGPHTGTLRRPLSTLTEQSGQPEHRCGL